MATLNSNMRYSHSPVKKLQISSDSTVHVCTIPVVKEYVYHILVKSYGQGLPQAMDLGTKNPGPAC